ncbi:hypothetical protein OIU84_020580 [Salix udensis]|uniref:Uncharacterized protein n=1 Tax=Salix udensis TaxID=889485 RepID=A0AAD6PFZ5_9ROSI|nr:hypothetical protein OIU84_020580 [Salix udensis]
MAAVCEKIVENVIVAKNRLLTTNQYNQRDCCSAAAPYNHRNFLSFHGGKKLLPKYHCGFVNRRNIYCNAAPSTTSIPYLEKVDFMKLQNGSDIRGVAVAGVEGEPVTLTEPVTEAIAAAFSAWLLEMKRADAPKPFESVCWPRFPHICTGVAGCSFSRNCWCWPGCCSIQTGIYPCNV